MPPSHRHSHSQPALVAAAALGLLVSVVGVLGGAARGRAQLASVPVSLQVQLLSRVVQYDRSFGTRASAGAVVLVVAKPGDALSSRTAGQIADSLRRLGTLGSAPINVIEVPFSTPAALADHVRGSGAAVVYLSTGLTSQVTNIAEALSGNAVLSVSASDADAVRGAVLAFELVEASPRLVVNLDQARRQQIVFSAGLLRLARVIGS